jgi:hypothetical protein
MHGDALAGKLPGRSEGTATNRKMLGWRRHEASSAVRLLGNHVYIFCHIVAIFTPLRGDFYDQLNTLAPR